MQSIVNTACKPRSQVGGANIERSVLVKHHSGTYATNFVAFVCIFGFDRNVNPRLRFFGMRHIVDIGRFNVFALVQAVKAGQKRFNPPSWRIFGHADLSSFWNYTVEMMAQSGAAQPSNVLPAGSSTLGTSANSGEGSSKSQAFAEFTPSLGRWESRWMRGWMRRILSARNRAMMAVET